MDFFGQQEAARRRTGRLVLYFVLAVVTIIAAIHGVAVLVFVHIQREQGLVIDPIATLLDPVLFGYAAGGTLAVVLVGSLFKIAQLRRGGPAVAEALGAVPVNPDTLDRNERRLLNVVEEMAIAAGMPVPPVYVMPDETGINAFAAGFSASDAVVSVTRGTLTRLSRDELQGVVAHEFSHILNGDMRLNIRLMGVLHGILLIALIGRSFLRGGGRSRSSSRNGKGRALILLVALALLLIGSLGVLFGRMIKAAVSREREYLADAAAVQFTRNPDGIAGALKKIGGFAGGSTLTARNAEFASHLYFARGLKGMSSKMFATHPPLEDRIRRIDPQWNAEYPTEPAEVPEAADETEGVAGFAGPAAEPPPPSAAAQTESMALAPDEAASRAGTPTPAHMDYAHAMLSQVPLAVIGAAHEPYGARALAYALVIGRDDEAVWRKQLDLLLHADPGVLHVMDRIAMPVAALGRRSYLPLITLCGAALRQLSERQYNDFRQTLEILIEADDVVTPFEFALLRVLRRQMDRHFSRTARAGTIRRSLSGRVQDCAVLLSALAHVGHDDEAAAEAAYRAGFARLELKAAPAMVPADRTGFAAVGAALDRLEPVAPLDKRKLTAACAAAIASDGRVTVEEGEILRAVSDSLDVPMPPFLAGERPATGSG